MGGTITFRDLEDDISAMLYLGEVVENSKFKGRFDALSRTLTRDPNFCTDRSFRSS
jgi:hypothetical protein